MLFSPQRLNNVLCLNKRKVLWLCVNSVFLNFIKTRKSEWIRPQISGHESSGSTDTSTGQIGGG